MDVGGTEVERFRDGPVDERYGRSVVIQVEDGRVVLGLRGARDDVLDIDRGRDASASNGKARVSNDTDDLRGIVEFADILIGQFSDLAPIIEKKMRIHIRPGVRSQLTSFVGTLDGTQRGFLFVRPYNNDRTVLEAGSPVDVVGMSDHVRNLIAGKEHFTLSEARALKDRLVHGSVKRTV